MYIASGFMIYNVINSMCTSIYQRMPHPLAYQLLYIKLISIVASHRIMLLPGFITNPQVVLYYHRLSSVCSIPAAHTCIAYLLYGLYYMSLGLAHIHAQHYASCLKSRSSAKCRRYSVNGLLNYTTGLDYWTLGKCHKMRNERCCWGDVGSITVNTQLQ